MFYYTNFIAETNAWWLRRVRPIWMGATVIWAYAIFHRYYFFGKEAVKAQRGETVAENKRRAEHNRSHFGFQTRYEPTLERSRKKMIMNLLGDKYDQAIAFENRVEAVATFEALQAKIDEENDY